MGCLTGNKPFNFGADLDQDPDPGIFIRIFTTLQDMTNCKNFAGQLSW